MRLRPNRVLRDFLGSAHVFASALSNVLERKLVGQASEGQLTPAQMKVLQLVVRTETHSVGDVAVFLDVSSAAASKTVDKLVRGGWLRRIEAKPDRRATRLFLTASGKKLLRSYETARLRSMSAICRQMRIPEVLDLAKRLDVLSARIVKHVVRSEDICLQCGIHLRERCVIREESGAVCAYRRAKNEEETVKKA
jgi:DNA-binding MarR family transcriptional regulator